MGRHNHENTVAIPGFDDLVVLSGDDTFTSGPLTIPAGWTHPGRLDAPAQSQLYSYIAAGHERRAGTTRATCGHSCRTTRASTTTTTSPRGRRRSVSGHFVKVPKNIATGLDTDGSELKAADVGFPLPPTDGSWQRDLRSTTPQVGIDGPQWVLEYWSQLNNVFQFVRVEDIAYDKRPGMDNVVYVVDSGRGTRRASPGRGRVDQRPRLEDGARSERPDDGDVARRSLVEGDDNAVKTLGEIHQPDNIEIDGQRDLLVTEDPGSSQQFTPAQQVAIRHAHDGAAVVRPVLGLAQVVVEGRPVALDGGPTDVDRHASSPGNWGAWETSGIVDASDGVRPRLVPHRRPGAHAVGREGAG